MAEKFLNGMMEDSMESLSDERSPKTRWIVGLGESLFDVFPTREVLGGAPLNFAFHAAQLHLPPETRVSVATRVGMDRYGKEIEERLSGNQISLQGLQCDPHRKTGRVDIFIESGEPTYTFLEDSAWDAIEWNESLKAIARNAVAVCYGTLAQRSEKTQKTMRSFLGEAKEAIRLFDVNVREPHTSDHSIQIGSLEASMIKCNDHELPRLCRVHSIDFTDLCKIDAMMNAMHQLRVKLNLDAIMVTRGEQGCMLATAEDSTIGDPVPGSIGPESDPVGAGDATAAVLVLGRLKQWPSERIVKVANRIGSFVASQAGATPQLPPELVALTA